MKNKILLETGTNEMELLAVIIDNQYFGINVAKVQSIQQFDMKLVTKMPKAAEGIIGMFYYRKSNIPLIDLATILGKNHAKEDEKEIVVVTEFNNSINSFKVHGINKIHRLSWDRLMPLEGIIGGNSFVTGSVIIDDNEILVLDLEHILATLFPKLTLEDVAVETIEEKESLSRENLKIYFAEDSATIRTVVVKALAKAGYSDVTKFENGQVAYDFFNNEIDRENLNNKILISDIEMPILDGLTLCKNLKNDTELKDIHVIMFSSLINTQMIEKCKSVGADNYVTKPEVNKLVHMLDEFCEKN